MLRHICCRMSKPFTIVIILAHFCSLARGVSFVTDDRDGNNTTSTSVDPAVSTDCDKVFLLTVTGIGPFTYVFSSGNTNSAFSTATDPYSGDEKITCDTTLLNSNSLTSYTLVVTLTDAGDLSTTEKTLTVTVTLPTLGISCSDNTGCTMASGEVCETVCKLGNGENCASNTGSCVSHATCATTCSCDSGFLDDGSKLCKAALDTRCSADTDCDTSTYAGAVCDTNASPNACKLGVGSACSVNNMCVTNGACETNECSCESGFTAQSNLCTDQSSSGFTTLTCYHCSLGTNCNKDDVNGNTQSSTSGSDNCVYCYIAWNDTIPGVVRGCLSSTTAASKSITKSGCSVGWSEGLYGTGCACQTDLCNETPTMAGYRNTATQLNDFMIHLRLPFVTLCAFLLAYEKR